MASLRPLAESDAIQLRVQNGEFATAGEAGNKMAELQAIECALGSVVNEQREFESQLADIEAERLRDLEVERVRGIGAELEAALDRRDARLRDAAVALETEMNAALSDWSEIYALQSQLDRVADADEALLRAAHVAEIHAKNKDAHFIKPGEMYQTPGTQGARICYNLAAQNHRQREINEINAKLLASDVVLENAPAPALEPKRGRSKEIAGAFYAD